jgi:hypothetical protein
VYDVSPRPVDRFAVALNHGDNLAVTEAAQEAANETGRVIVVDRG